jgi:hypothetical protein
VQSPTDSALKYDLLGLLWRILYMLVQAILDKEEFTLDELLNEEDIIQECKSANSRLVQ